MADYTHPVHDSLFIINDVFKLPEQWAASPTLNERIDKETVTAMLNECSKISSELIAPFSIEADAKGCQLNQGVVTTAPSHKKAFQAITEGGWGSLTGNPDFGGLGMPKALAVHCDEIFAAADLSFSLFPMLTAGACLAIDQHASQALKTKYLPKMYSGEWAGSMCLTEPHAGSDLGIIKTKAIADDGDSYRLTGTKIFITGGEHDLTDNIIHLVLAKLPDAPAGPRGISLFLVPKLLDDGKPNTLSCGSLEHKMGIKASPTCVMNFDGAIGYLVGQENKGLMAMFTMMNYERVGVGIQGIGPAERSYQCAASYARERLQGRSPQSKLTPNTAESLLVHPDVRRMLLTMRALTEASRCFSTYVANQLDLHKYSKDEEVRAQAELKIALLTPIVKSFCTDRGFESCVLGQQVLGGHGYMHDWGQEQLVRDVRITQIYEGTNGIQAMDLLARKIIPNKGQTVMDLVTEMKTFSQQQQLPLSIASSLNNEAEQLATVTRHLVDNANNDLIGANAVYYQDLIGYVLYAYMWALMITAAQSDSSHHRNKHLVAEFYFNNLLTRTSSLRQTILADHQSIMTLDNDDF